MADDRLIAALDVPTRTSAEQLVARLGDSVSYYKVGMELFYALGGGIVTWLKEREKKVFLDLKLHDIPNTVGNGLCSLLRLRPDILNVHTAGGLRMMKTASEALHSAAEAEGIPCPKLIGVTVLTSMEIRARLRMPFCGVPGSRRRRGSTAWWRRLRRRRRFAVCAARISSS